MIRILNTVLELSLHLDDKLDMVITQYGSFTYIILFLIIFAETGFVVTPFLPGDSLLFATGAFSALESLDIMTAYMTLLFAAVLGDTINYWIGHYIGRYMVNNPKIPINKTHVSKTKKFYRKHGGKTVILARFVPVMRTFAPFVAGVGHMDYPKFLTYSVIGSVLWISIFTLGGYFFGNISLVRANFEVVVVAIVFVSLLPVFFNWVKSKWGNPK